MNLSVKLILASLSLSALFSCTSSSNEDELFKEVGQASQVAFLEQGTDSPFLNVTLTPDSTVCNKSLVVVGELISSSGFDYTQVVQANEGIIEFAVDEKVPGGSYSITFRESESGEIVKSTSFYITDDDTEKNNYVKSVEYSNCNF